MEQWTAREDLKHRLWTARASIERFLALQHAQIMSIRAMPPGPVGYTIDQQRLNSQTSSAVDSVLNDANNLSRALRSRHLPPTLRGRTLGDLAEPIRHVRNLLEHWDENRVFWETASPVPAGQKYASARWYKQHFPDKTPWSSGWSNVDGAVIGGIIPLRRLVQILDELDSALQISGR